MKNGPPEDKGLAVADIAQLKQNLADAEAAKEELLDTRRANRETMSKSDFRTYNEDTRQEQIDVEKAISAAQSALTQALNTARQELMVGTLSESDKVGG